MTKEEKRFTRCPVYSEFSDKQKQEFKKALFLSKGGVNNVAGGILAEFGLPGEDIAKYGTGWKGESGIEMSKFLPTRAHWPSENMQERITRKLLVQQVMRIPDLFDTIKGRTLVAKYGEEIKDEFCDEFGRCPMSVVSFGRPYVKMLDDVALVDGTVKGYRFAQIMSRVEFEFSAGFSAEKALKLDFFARTKALTIAKAKSKNIDLWSVFEAGLGHPSYDLESFPEFKKDFGMFIKQDFEALANAPDDITRKLGVIGVGDRVEDIYTVATSLSRNFAYHAPYGASFASWYGVSPEAKYNSLYIKAMYVAMDEMGVGIGSSSQLRRGSRRKLATSVKKTTKKVIAFNEKYQKMLKNKSNTIEPAILRQTLVGMFNEFADRDSLHFRMFIREDRPAPTLASLKSTKKPKKATTTQTSKHPSEQKRVVTDAEGNKFVEY